VFKLVEYLLTTYKEKAFSTFIHYHTTQHNTTQHNTTQHITTHITYLLAEVIGNVDGTDSVFHFEETSTGEEADSLVCPGIP